MIIGFAVKFCVKNGAGKQSFSPKENPNFLNIYHSIFTLIFLFKSLLNDNPYYVKSTEYCVISFYFIRGKVRPK